MAFFLFFFKHKKRKDKTLKWLFGKIYIQTQVRKVKNIKKEKHYKTYQIWIKNGHRMHSYFKTSCELAKNMYNTTNFYYRQVYTALTQIKELQPLQKEVLSTIQDNIGKMNDAQLLAYQKKKEKEELKPLETRKDVKCNLFEIPTKENPYVDYNFLDALFKVIVQNDYRSFIPCFAALYVIMLIRCFKYYEKGNFTIA